MNKKKLWERNFKYFKCLIDLFFSITKTKNSLSFQKILFLKRKKKKEKRKKKRTFLRELTFDFPCSNKSWTIWWCPLKAAVSSAVAPYSLRTKKRGEGWEGGKEWKINKSYFVLFWKCEFNPFFIFNKLKL